MFCPLPVGNDGVMVGLYNDNSYRLTQIPESEPVMASKKASYKSYLIRICSDEAHQMRQVMVTRISEAGEQHHFTNLDDLMIFLLQEMEPPSKGELPIF